MHPVNILDFAAFVGVMCILVGVYLWLGLGAAIFMAGALLLAFSVKVAASGG